MSESFSPIKKSHYKFSLKTGCLELSGVLFYKAGKPFSKRGLLALLKMFYRSKCFTLRQTRNCLIKTRIGWHQQIHSFAQCSPSLNGTLRFKTSWTSYFQRQPYIQIARPILSTRKKGSLQNGGISLRYWSLFIIINMLQNYIHMNCWQNANYKWQKQQITWIPLCITMQQVQSN